MFQKVTHKNQDRRSIHSAVPHCSHTGQRKNLLCSRWLSCTDSQFHEGVHREGFMRRERGSDGNCLSCGTRIPSFIQFPFQPAWCRHSRSKQPYYIWFGGSGDGFGAKEGMSKQQENASSVSFIPLPHCCCLMSQSLPRWTIFFLHFCWTCMSGHLIAPSGNVKLLGNKLHQSITWLLICKLVSNNLNVTDQKTYCTQVAVLTVSTYLTFGSQRF